MDFLARAPRLMRAIPKESVFFGGSFPGCRIDDADPVGSFKSHFKGLSNVSRFDPDFSHMLASDKSFE